MAHGCCGCFIKYALAAAIVLFLAVSVLSLMGISISIRIPLPNYPWIIFLVLDAIFIVGLVGVVTEHLRVVIVFGWIVGLLLMLSFFGATVSIHSFSDFYGLTYITVVTVLVFSHAAIEIKHRYKDSEEPCSFHNPPLGAVDSGDTRGYVDKHEPAFHAV